MAGTPLTHERQRAVELTRRVQKMLDENNHTTAAQDEAIAYLIGVAQFVFAISDEELS